ATPYGNDVVIYYNNGHETFQTCDIHRFSKIMARSSLGAFVLQVIRLPYLPIKHSVGCMGELDYGGADPNDYYVKIVHNGINYTEFNVNGLTGPQCFIRLDGIVNSNGLFYNKTLAEMGLYEGLENTLPTAEQWAEVKANPYNIERDRRFESKLLCYPYRYNVLTDWKNQPIILKNEYIGSDKITVKYTQGIGFNAPARYWVDKYRKDPEGRFNSLIQLAQEDVPVITDAYYNYMLQNRNQLQADRTNALVSIAGNTLSGTVNGAIAGGSAGGIPGALFGGLTSGVGAMFSGGINYSNMIRDQQAKQGDLKNLPDTIVNNNDTAFSVQDNNKHICLYRKKICCEFEEMLADVFNTSGYTVNRMKVPNLRSRLRYNYIKTMGANIVGSFNQEDLAKIKAIFNNGVTFWHYNTVNFKPFDYSLENIETSLI
ncbi:MAG: hypothetical protein J6R88_04755, partial [Clostridia bacterium]|nr:hypothetical protein [Clostridia bacterium]